MSEAVLPRTSKTPEKSGRTRDKEPEVTYDILVGGYQKPGDKSGYRQDDWAEGKPEKLAQKFPVRENSPKTLELSTEKDWTLKIERGTLKNRVGSSSFIQKDKMFGKHPQKTKT